MRTDCFSSLTDITAVSSTDKLRKGRMTSLFNMQAVKFLFSFLKATSSPGVGRTVITSKARTKAGIWPEN